MVRNFFFKNLLLLACFRSISFLRAFTVCLRSCNFLVALGFIGKLSKELLQRLPPLLRRILGARNQFSSGSCAGFNESRVCMLSDISSRFERNCILDQWCEVGVVSEEGLALHVTEDLIFSGSSINCSSLKNSLKSARSFWKHLSINLRISSSFLKLNFGASVSLFFCTHFTRCCRQSTLRISNHILKLLHSSSVLLKCLL